MTTTKPEKVNNDKEKQDRYSIHAIEKALDVIIVLSEHDSLSLIELVELVNQPKSSLYRIILTLEKRGFISRSEDDGKFCLGFQQLVITKNLLERSSLRTAALVDMNKLVAKYGDTVNLCILSDDEVVYVEIIEGTYALRMSDTVGSKAPIHASAAGKMLAAHLPKDILNKIIEEKGLPPLTPNTLRNTQVLLQQLTQIKEQGYAIDNEEIVQGARCVAAPIFNMFGRVEGALSLSGAKHRFPDDQLTAIAQDLMLAGKSISQKLGYMS